MEDGGCQPKDQGDKGCAMKSLTPRFPWGVGGLPIQSTLKPLTFEPGVIRPDRATVAAPGGSGAGLLVGLGLVLGGLWIWRRRK